MCKEYTCSEIRYKFLLHLHKNSGSKLKGREKNDVPQYDAMDATGGAGWQNKQCVELSTPIQDLNVSDDGVEPSSDWYFCTLSTITIF